MTQSIGTEAVSIPVHFAMLKDTSTPLPFDLVLPIADCRDALTARSEAFGRTVSRTVLSRITVRASHVTPGR